MKASRKDGARPGPWLGAALCSAAGALLARDLFCAAGGSESALAACLGAAAGWVALGSVLAGRLRAGPGPIREAALLMLAPPVLTVQIWAARGPVALAAGLSGGALAPGTLALAAAVLTAPSGMLCGLLLPGLGTAGGGTGGGYWARLGSAMAAGTAAVALAGSSGLGLLMAWAVLCAAYACLVSAVLSPELLRRGKMLMALWAALLSAGGVGFAASSVGRGWLRGSAGIGGLVAPADRVLENIETPRGPLVLARGEAHVFGLFRNGRLLARCPDPAARPDAVFACAQAPSIGNVLVLGGGRPELVRELLTRGAGRVEVLSAGPEADELMTANLAGSEVDVLRSDRVRRRYGNLRRMLQEPGAEYDLALFAPPAPLCAETAAVYSREFLADLAVRLAPRGVLVISLPAPARENSEWQARVYATLREVGEERRTGSARLLGVPAAFPADRLRLAAPAPRAGALCDNPAMALARYRTHLLADGSRPVPAGIDDFSRLIDAAAVRATTERLLARAAAAEVIRETGLTPAVMLDCLQEDLDRRSPASAAALSAVRRMPLPVPYAAVWLTLLVMWVLARRERGGGPGRLTLAGAAFTAGLVAAVGTDLCCTIYSAGTGALWGALPLAAAAFAAGMGGAAALSLRLEPAAGRAPRRALAVVQFAGLLLLMLGIQVARADATGAWTDLACGLGLFLLGAVAGAELTLVTSAAADRRGPGTAFVTAAAWAGLGALTGSALAVSMLLASIGPVPAILLAISFRIAMLGLLAAGYRGGRDRNGDAFATATAPGA